MAGLTSPLPTENLNNTFILPAPELWPLSSTQVDEVRKVDVRVVEDSAKGAYRDHGKDGELSGFEEPYVVGCELLDNGFYVKINATRRCLTL